MSWVRSRHSCWHSWPQKPQYLLWFKTLVAVVDPATKNLMVLTKLHLLDNTTVWESTDPDNAITPELPQEPIPAYPNPELILHTEPILDESSQMQQVHKTWTINLHACICGMDVSEDEIQVGDDVFKCKVLGCETLWVSDTVCIVCTWLDTSKYHHKCMNYDFTLKYWSCPSCKASAASTKCHCIWTLAHVFDVMHVSSSHAIVHIQV